MTESTNDNIFSIAEKINDGKPIDDELLESGTSAEILAAFKKINKITNQIRQQSDVPALLMREGDRWAHLEIINKIGEGGVGEVYCAYDPILNSKVAVKFLSTQSQLYISEQQFLDEARHIATVRHPHVLAIHGATIDEGIAGYWSDYLNGTLLSEYLHQEGYDWDQQLIHAQQLCQAVKAIHTNDLVHGDIKALNVMIQPERGAILLDFGSSRHNTTRSNVDYIEQASPMAMAPEQFRGQTASHGSDVFSLGLLFWQLSTHKHPLEGLGLTEIKREISQLTQHKHKIKRPKQWKKLILRMVSNDVKLRPSIDVVQQKLAEIAQGPTKRAKQLALASVLVLALGITSISTYSTYKTKQAQKETQAMNTLLNDILMKSSPIEDGKDVLLIDVLTDAENSIKNNQEISDQMRSESLLQLVRTYRHQGKHQKSIDLATSLSEDPSSSDSIKMDSLMQKSAALNMLNEFDEAEQSLLEVIKMTPVSDQDATVQISSLINLIYNYNESYQLDKVPPLIKQAKTLWKKSLKKEAALANIYLVEGNYFEIKEQYNKAYEMYQKSIENYTIYYGEKNIDVMIAEGAAATVLTYQDSTLVKGIGELELVLKKMTDFLGDSHSSTLIVRVNLADAYSQNNQHQRGVDTLAPFMQFVYEGYGQQSGMSLAFKNVLANLYKNNKNIKAATDELNEIINIETQKNGPNSEHTFAAQLNLVILYTETQQLQAAHDLIGQLKTSGLEHLPKDHRLLLDIEEFYIWTKHLLGEENAELMMQQLINDKTRILGSDDPSTLSAIKHFKLIQN